ncbi:hypothetical protein DI005_18660 [Prauserella sp. PE36]|uniref:Uncharacterized protein n=1 Tax=Prauserella endophytica TaxID=1592324 RepID=A0ABY2RXB7_9PSEU|nr:MULTISPECIES: hypothetical protein [Prauserella]PXY19833.1 hypothetical protein BAY59_32730 [Prauserella coralliicola]RBM18488.1 hypothetical protein DI005_18660 [Prauserella sp. PE36]TKG64288.1 hypothetical protein FCN18_29215 [Prauserella endophytica]
MDPRDRANAVLSRAQTRDGVVTPDNMTSPMDAANTQQIPGSVVRRLDTEQDPDTTTKLSASFIESSDSHLAESQPTTRLDAAQAANAEPEVEQTEISGLVPTTRTMPTRSNVARRLEGL